jgi:hypothetical protein
MKLLRWCRRTRFLGDGDEEVSAGRKILYDKQRIRDFQVGKPRISSSHLRFLFRGEKFKPPTHKLEGFAELRTVPDNSEIVGVGEVLPEGGGVREERLPIRVVLGVP